MSAQRAKLMELMNSDSSSSSSEAELEVEQPIPPAPKAEGSAYDRTKWIKVRYNNKMKRIYEPPK